MHRDDVGGCQQRFKIDVIGHGAAGVRGIGVIGQHLHTECARGGGRAGADLTEAQDPQGLSVEFDQRIIPVAPVYVVFPFAGMHGLAVMAYMEAGLQHQRDRVLAHRRAAVCGDIGDGDAPLFRVGNVDNVITGRQHVDEFYARAGVNDIFRDRHLFRVDQFGVSDTRYNLLLVRLRRAVVYGQIAQSAQFVPAQIV